MAGSPMPTKFLRDSITFNNRTDNIDNTSDLTKSKDGNPIGDRIAGIVASSDTSLINATRYYARPGEAISTWTGEDQVQLKPASCAPLTENTKIIVENKVGGIGLTFVGANGAGPIPFTRIEDDQTLTVNAYLSRYVNDPVSNNITFKIKCFSFTGSYLGEIEVPTVEIPILPTVTKISYSVSKVPGAADGELPAGTRYLRPYVGGKGSTGRVTLYNVVIGDVASSLEAALKDAVVQEVVPKTQLILTFDAETKSIPVFFSIAALEKALTEQFIPHDVSTTANAVPKRLIPYDSNRNGGELLNVGTSGTLLIGIGNSPTAGQSNTIQIAPGCGWEMTHGRKDEIWVASTGSAVPVNGFYTNTSGIDVLAVEKSEAYIARQAGTMPKAWGDAFRQLYLDLSVEGSLTDMTSMRCHAGYTQSGSLIDMIRIDSAAATISGSLPWARGVGFTGGNGYISTGYVPKDDPAFQLANHSMGFYAYDDGTQGTLSMGSGTVGIGPNRSSDSAAYRSGSPSSDLLGGLVTKGLFALTRSEIDRFTSTAQETSRTISRTAETLGNTPYELIVYANGGLNVGTSSPIRGSFDFAGRFMSVQRIFAAHRAMKRFLATVAGL